MSLADRVEGWVNALLPVGWFAVVIVILVAAKRNEVFQTLLGRIKKVSGFGLDLEFSEGAAQRNRQVIEKDLGELRRSLQREIDQRVQTLGIVEKRQQVLEAMRVKISATEYRSTIHIPDPLLANALYQLLDYHPAGGGKGRSFSTRTGLIGRAWRLNQTQSEPDLGSVDRPRLISDWGMTPAEADASQANGRKSFLAVVLRDGPATIAIFYFDSKSANAFSAADFATELETRCSESLLQQSLSSLVADLRKSTPQIEIGQ